jgi:CheY-like chemotaxis protein
MGNFFHLSISWKDGSPVEMKTDRRKPFVWLVVDDDEDDCLLVKEAVEETSIYCEFEVDLRFLHTGIALLSYLESTIMGGPAKTPRPHLIFLDLNMPQMAGSEVLKRLKSSSEFKDIPVVVFTTSNRRATVLECYRFGANSFIQKPAEFTGLTNIIQSVAKYWGCIAESPGESD